MRLPIRLPLALVMALGLLSVATAQETPPEMPEGLEALGNIGNMQQIIGGFLGIDMNGSGFDKMILLQQEAVQVELKMTEKQVAQVKEKLDNLPGMSMGKGGAQTNPAQSLAALSNSLATMGPTIDNALTTILRSGQIKRLKEISLQQRGTQALADPEIQNQLNLTSVQRKQISTIMGKSKDNWRDKIQQAIADGSVQTNIGASSTAGVQPGSNQMGFSMRITAPGAPPSGPAAANPARPPKTEAEQREDIKKAAEVFSGTDEELFAVLTKSQTEKFQRLRGKPFKFNLIEQAMKERKIPGVPEAEPSQPAAIEHDEHDHSHDSE